MSRERIALEWQAAAAKLRSQMDATVQVLPNLEANTVLLSAGTRCRNAMLTVSAAHHRQRKSLQWLLAASRRREDLMTLDRQTASVLDLQLLGWIPRLALDGFSGKTSL